MMTQPSIIMVLSLRLTRILNANFHWHQLTVFGLASSRLS